MSNVVQGRGMAVQWVRAVRTVDGDNMTKVDQRYGMVVRRVLGQPLPAQGCEREH